MISANEGQAAPPPSLLERAERLTDTIKLAYSIADEAARSDIEQWAAELGDRWYDLNPELCFDDYERRALARAAKYLCLRGHLDVDPVDVLRVRVK